MNNSKKILTTSPGSITNFSLLHGGVIEERREEIKQRNIVFSALLFLSLPFIAFAQFAPPVGHAGTTAISKDSSVFCNWASACKITRGFQDVSTPSTGYASAGDSSMALGIPGNGVVSLGDGGIATLHFSNGISDGPGWDFAVFENGFDDLFLELAFVEVSSDGIHFHRFPATSNTPANVQTDGFGYTDARKINNLAGKYRGGYGTPFDLSELKDTPGLNVQYITHIRIIDVIGCIQDTYATKDAQQQKINDPWPTPFASSGFDLDAVGVIHQVTGIEEQEMLIAYQGPNPINSHLSIHAVANGSYTLNIYNLCGAMYYSERVNGQIHLITSEWPDGIYIIETKKDEQYVIRQKIIILHP